MKGSLPSKAVFNNVDVPQMQFRCSLDDWKKYVFGGLAGGIGIKAMSTKLSLKLSLETMMTL